LLDNLFELYNVFAVVSFGPQNNLSSPNTFTAAGVAKRIISSWYEADTKANALVSERYNKLIGQKDAPKANATGGDLSQWAYYHYGRYSFSTPGWWVPKAKADTTKKEKPLTIEDPTANYLRWAASQGINTSFTNWQKIDHPDFPGKTVEVGGVDPFALINPPYKLVGGIVQKHSNFLYTLASMAPELDIVNVKTERVSEGLSRVTATILNRGDLPTQTKVGERSYWIKKISVNLNTKENQTVISGRKSQVLDAIEGHGSQTLTWLVKGSGSFTLEAGSPTTGTKTIDINL